MRVTHLTARARGQRKVRIGQVVSNKMQKTIVVRVVRRVRHPLYERIVTQANSFKAHDERNEAKIGDWVKIMETRPISKDKRWRFVEIVKRASTAPPVPGQEPAQTRVSEKRTTKEGASPAPQATKEPDRP